MVALAEAEADPVVEAALSQVERHHAAPGFGPAAVARALGYSPAHLTTRVRRATGLPLGAWIAERRMAEARRLLAATATPLGEVAAAVGYADPESLARRFRRAHGGLTPGAWRRAHRGDPARR